MFSMLSSWKGPIEVNTIRYESFNEFLNATKGDFSRFNNTQVSIKLLHSEPLKKSQNVGQIDENQEYLITVKKYMTQTANNTFDFMLKYNKDVPMPLRTMIGVKVKETKGMVYMKLRADIYANQIQHCMKCGRAITNPVSKYFGMGPECGGHGYTNPFTSKEELEQSVRSYRKQLQNITWEGWIIKSAIIEEELYDVKTD